MSSFLFVESLITNLCKLWNCSPKDDTILFADIAAVYVYTKEIKLCPIQSDLLMLSEYATEKAYQVAQKGDDNFKMTQRDL